jgi:hypothetical protein
MRLHYDFVTNPSLSTAIRDLLAEGTNITSFEAKLKTAYLGCQCFSMFMTEGAGAYLIILLNR